jgi:hypothetical protein
MAGREDALDGGQFPNLPINDTTVTIVVVILVALVVWTLLKFVARLIAAAIIVGLLLVGLAMVAGRLTGQPPEAVVDSVIATVTAESTRTARDLLGRDDFGRLDKMGLTPTPAPPTK